MTDVRIEWGNDLLELAIRWDDDHPAWIEHMGSPGAHPAAVPLLVSGGGSSVNQPLQPQPLVEVLGVGTGHLCASDRLVHSVLGAQLRVTSHSIERDRKGWSTLVLVQQDPGSGLIATARLEMPDHVASVRGSIQLSLSDRQAVPVVVESLALAFMLGVDHQRIEKFDLVSMKSDWLAENRWERRPLRESGLPAVDWNLHHADPKGAVIRASTGTWSTGSSAPSGFLVDREARTAWAWQVEASGAWRWEVGERRDGLYLALSGPTDRDHQWHVTIRPGDTFVSVPVSWVRTETGFEGAVAELTDYRRASRRAHPDNAALPVVFNDYMNTVMGDPSTEKLLPLIDAAGAAGAEIFVLDAGWYDDGGDWWDSVGEWTPSTVRFPGGFREVVDRIRERGMMPGLWLEPEVIGVRSARATALPDSAFLQRHGVRVREHDRFHLDLRDTAARAHLDAVVDRLIEDFGVGYFKLDYNINGGPGTDRDADSVGAGLLEHNRAHLAWLDSLLDRHPGLMLENCASGAMRQDFAMLSRLQVQSTSDQQSALRYPPIAVAAPLVMIPEQAANWAYPQPGMDPEDAAFTLVTSMLGRFYLSGYLNRMTVPERELVAEAVEAHRGMRAEIRNGRSRWPLGIPGWDDPWLAYGLADEDSLLLSVWRRGGSSELDLPLPEFAGHDVTVVPVFPASAERWGISWDSDSAVLRLTASASVSARTLRVTAS